MKIEWSAAALADLDRFAGFLHDRHPDLSTIVAREIIDKTRLLSDQPRLGRPLAGRPEYRRLVLKVLNARYLFQSRFDGERLVMLRVFHGREHR